MDMEFLINFLMEEVGNWIEEEGRTIETLSLDEDDCRFLGTYEDGSVRVFYSPETAVHWVLS